MQASAVTAIHGKVTLSALNDGVEDPGQNLGSDPEPGIRTGP